jgi:endonuclease G
MNLETQHFKKYVGQIAQKHGGIEGLREVMDKKLRRRAVRGLESASEDDAAVATEALESLALDRDPTPPQRMALEAIIDAEIRPVIDIIDGKFVSTHPLWTRLSTDAPLRQRIETCIKSIGRLELPGHRQLPYGGTAFVVGDGLIMTNRHVAEIFAAGLGTQLRFRRDARAGIDFLRERGGRNGQVFTVRRLVMIHPYWDMALLAVDGIDTRSALPLSLLDARDLNLRDIAVIGYPAFDSRNPEDVQNDLFRGEFGIKRLQPGELKGGLKTASFGKLVNAATHDCSTLGGNSGSAVIDLDTGAVMALHFGGRYREQNFAVPAFELARDQRVIDAGVKFEGTPSPDATDWADWWNRADSERLDEDDADTSSTPSRSSAAATSSGAATTVRATAGTMTFELPIRFTVSLDAPRVIGAQPGETARAVAEGIGAELEAMREPFRDTDYSTRRGYDPKFLGGGNGASAQFLAPMPKAKNSQSLAHDRDGNEVINYQNFSILMHAARRLALVTASNVTREPNLRKPDPSKDYTRKALSGLGKNDIEKWFLDPRLESRFQIPDVFFTKDRKAFDKGHLVRRDDVAWGRTYDEVRRANGDSYHVTNCSPQVSEFNQSSRGEDNWGDLENHVLSEAATERLCVFAGPVLDGTDQVFHGVGDGGSRIRARIPTRFWKVIVARVEDGVAAYGFILDQDVSDVQFEFVVSDEFVPTMFRLSEIEDLTGVVFDDALKQADQFDSIRGNEIAQRSGARPRKKK